MKFRVIFEIDEEVEADDREEAVEKAIGNVVGGQALVDGLGDFDDVREIEKKLKIAVKALMWVEEQADTSTQYDYEAEVILKNIVFDARQALKEIKG